MRLRGEAPAGVGMTLVGNSVSVSVSNAVIFNSHFCFLNLTSVGNARALKLLSGRN